MKGYEIRVNWNTASTVESLRSEHGLSYKEFEDLFDVSELMLIAADNGRDTIKPSHIERMCRYFGIEPAALRCEIV